MTTVEERLAVLETSISDVKSDVVEIRTDVKALLAFMAARESVSSLGRYLIPMVALLVSAAAFLRGG